jgi:uracil-DNA glycosylase
MNLDKGPFTATVTPAKYPIFPIMHPAYLLRNEAAKVQAWEDMKLLSREIEQRDLIPDYKGIT